MLLAVRLVTVDWCVSIRLLFRSVYQRHKIPLTRTITLDKLLSDTPGFKPFTIVGVVGVVTVVDVIGVVIVFVVSDFCLTCPFGSLPTYYIPRKLYATRYMFKTVKRFRAYSLLPRLRSTGRLGEGELTLVWGILGKNVEYTN